MATRQNPEVEADRWVDAWLHALAQAGASPGQLTTQARALARAVTQVRPDPAAQATWDAFAEWVQQEQTR